MSVKISCRCLESVTVLESEMARLMAENSAELQTEYEALVSGLRNAQERRETEQALGNPILPAEVLQEAVPRESRGLRINNER